MIRVPAAGWIMRPVSASRVSAARFRSVSGSRASIREAGIGSPAYSAKVTSLSTAGVSGGFTTEAICGRVGGAWASIGVSVGAIVPASLVNGAFEEVFLLGALQRKYRMSYLFISHDLAVIRAMAHRVLVMKDGAIVEHGDAQSVFANPQQPYTRTLVAAAHLA